MTDFNVPPAAAAGLTRRWLSVVRVNLRRRATGRFQEWNGRHVAILFVLVAAVAAIPVITHPWPPLTDYMNHLARMHVIATIGQDADLTRFYEINWQIVPNLMMDLIVPLIMKVTGLYAAGQIYTIASFVVTIAGALVLNRQLFGRWSVLPLLAFPLVYNNVFIVGTLNYVFGIGLAIWSLAAWVALRERAIPLRLAVSAGCVLALFFCHLFVVGIYGIGLLAYELHRLGSPPQMDGAARRGRAARLADFVATGLPFLLVLPLLMSSPTLGLWSSFSWELEGKLEGLLHVVEMYSHVSAVVLTAIACFAMGWATRHGVLKFHPVGWTLLLVGALVYLAMPRIIFDTYMADQRLPISLLFLVIACASLSVRHPQVRRGFAVLLLAVMALRIYEVQTVWDAAAVNTDAFRESVQKIERGSTVLVTHADADGADDPRSFGLVHAACLAIIERSALVTNAFTVVGKQIMHVRADFRGRTDGLDANPPSVAQLVSATSDGENARIKYWANWSTDYDYVYVLFTTPEFVNPDARRFAPVYAGQRFVLYRVVPADVRAEAGDEERSIRAGARVATASPVPSAKGNGWRPLRLTR